MDLHPSNVNEDLKCESSEYLKTILKQTNKELLPLHKLTARKNITSEKFIDAIDKYTKLKEMHDKLNKDMPTPELLFPTQDTVIKIQEAISSEKSSIKELKKNLLDSIDKIREQYDQAKQELAAKDAKKDLKLAISKNKMLASAHELFDELLELISVQYLGYIQATNREGIIKVPSEQIRTYMITQIPSYTKIDILIQELNYIINIFETKNNQFLRLYNDYIKVTSVLETAVLWVKKEHNEKLSLQKKLEELSQTFLPNLDSYIKDESIRNRLLKNSISLLSRDDSKYNMDNGYDQMSVAEKFFLTDIESLIELFGKRNSFNIIEDQYKNSIKLCEQEIKILEEKLRQSEAKIQTQKKQIKL